MYIIAGLGNPGTQYEHTRHNIGFITVDAILHRYGFSDPKKKFKGLLSEGTITEDKVLLFKPMTFMNNSGIPLQELLRFYKVPLEKLIVLHDELDIPLGKVKAKVGGGAGGHNGLRSIDSHMGKNYTRIRMGIDHPGNKHQVTSYVLKPFSKAEQPTTEKMVDIVSQTIGTLLTRGIAEFLNQYALQTKG